MRPFITENRKQVTKKLRKKAKLSNSYCFSKTINFEVMKVNSYKLRQLNSFVNLSIGCALDIFLFRICTTSTKRTSNSDKNPNLVCLFFAENPC